MPLKMTTHLLIALLICTPVAADTLRCGLNLVSSGDNRFDVLEACGEPDYKELITYYTPVYERFYQPDGNWFSRRSSEPREAELWYYKPNRLRYTIRFEEGEIVRIDSD